MNTLKPAPTDYLLESGLESLHEQSMEWISDIAFWRDELTYLYALEVKKTLKKVPIHAKNKLAHIESELLKLSSGDIDKLYDEVVIHERFLNKLLESRKEDEASYREKHIQITNKVADFFLRFKTLKREIFEIVKQNKEANSIKL
jgi:hypothetical protein